MHPYTAGAAAGRSRGSDEATRAAADAKSRARSAEPDRACRPAAPFTRAATAHGDAPRLPARAPRRRTARVRRCAGARRDAASACSTLRPVAENAPMAPDRCSDVQPPERSTSPIRRRVLARRPSGTSTPWTA
ncbi:MAG: hypothetical protein MZV70_43870 [Desulfobacterales bacterium]|nr:hypothetical protein [Desulfobacterales bacterium]